MPIHNQVKSLMPPRSDFMEKDPLPKSQNAHISAPDLANFFRLQPIPYKRETKPPVLRPNLVNRNSTS